LAHDCPGEGTIISKEIAGLIRLWLGGAISRREFVRRASLLGGGAMLGPSLLAACGPGQPAQSPGTGAKAGGSIVVAQTTNPTTLDPQDTNDNLSFSIEKTMYDTLIAFDDKMNHVPGLATKWSASADAREFTFELRSGVTFHDGTPLNAQAVKASFDRVRDKSNNLRRWSLFNNIAEVVPVSDLRVTFRLMEPFGAFFGNVAHPAAGILSPAAIKQYGKDMRNHPVGTGPFKFVEWKLGERVVVERNPSFWQSGEPKVDRMTFRPVPEAGSRVAMLQTGEAQLVFPLPPIEVDRIRNHQEATVWEGSSIYAQYVALNNLKKPLDNKLVRQALNYAVDKTALIQVIARGHGKALDSPLAHDTWGHKSVKTYPYDVQKAKDLLRQAGYASGFRSKLWTLNTTESQDLGVAIQQQLKQAGVDIEIVPMEGPTRTNLLYKPPGENQMEMNLGGWSPSTGDGDWALRPLLARSSWPPTLFNTSFYDNPQVNDDIQQALSTADEAKRKRAYAHAQEVIVEDCPWIFLYVSRVFAGVRRNIGGMIVLPDDILAVRTAYFRA